MNFKKHLPAFFVICNALSISVSAQQSFKYDNTVYKAVYLNEAFRLMDSMRNYLLLDVRSPGEFADTARSTFFNIGKIKGAVNINVDDIPAHLEELKKHSDQPIFVYCSHSQRSRRVSKLLGENGFQKVYNINGGMSLINEIDPGRFPYKNKVLESNTAYQNIAPAEVIGLIKNEPGLVIIDIRTEPEFNSRDTAVQNNIGRFKKAINIPQNVFAEKFDSYKIPNSSPVLLYDLHGYNSMDVVNILRDRGFTKIYNLFEGLEAFIADHTISSELRGGLLTGMHPYPLIDAESAIDLLKQHPNTIVIDTRPSEEFNNKSLMTYRNMGRIKDAINIYSIELLNNFMDHNDKSALILVYSGQSDTLGIRICDALTKNGFQHVNFLNLGLYHFVWAMANIEDCKEGRSFLVDHEGLY